MSAIRKIAVSAAAVFFLGLGALFATSGTAVAAPDHGNYAACDSDWHAPCP
jgi:hypothetical protein